MPLAVATRGPMPWSSSARLGARASSAAFVAAQMPPLTIFARLATTPLETSTMRPQSRSREPGAVRSPDPIPRPAPVINAVYPANEPGEDRCMGLAWLVCAHPSWVPVSSRLLSRDPGGPLVAHAPLSRSAAPAKDLDLARDVGIEHCCQQFIDRCGNP